MTIVPACSPDGVPNVCEPGEPSEEVCNSIDDNCDGVVDEGCNCNDGDMQACYSGAAETKGIGECKDGTQSCVGGAWEACSNDVVPTAESCDGLDNDCDGQPDEDNPDGGGNCTTALPGVCATGVETCADGQLGCEAVHQPSNEICDGLDNDCNGMADDGNPGGGMSCTTGLLGECSAGTMTCQGGTLQCVQDKQAISELCDALDNDCNGIVDDGNPGGGGTCNTGMPGVCGPGTQTCQGGSLQCVQNQPAVNEICGDNQDNDCNGQVDDGCGCSHDKCTTGLALVSGCDPCVSSICQSDPYCCNVSWDSQCVGEVQTVCGSGTCAGNCPHSLCTPGPSNTPFTSFCDSPGTCVQLICALDSYCCNFDWDSICVSEVGTYCGLTC